MKIKAQMAMIMNLDKCIGCHTCSIPCKNVWTNRIGAEYIWYNNVETKPGIGYPKIWENQNIYNGGWEVANGSLQLKAGGKISKFVKIFHNPDLPKIDDYYEPWTYDYAKLISRAPGKHQPTARPKSLITGENIEIKWGPSWEDDLAGASTTAVDDVNFKDLQDSLYLNFQNVFMFYLPRICEHCLNPACVASCPSGALYKRDEDGIVLVDQERCRGWRYCVSGCPYKKVYFNWKAGRSEKCILCYPRMEAGMPTLCAESCVGRIRYIGAVLYDADRIKDVAGIADDRKVYSAHLNILLNPDDPEIISHAIEQGIPETFIHAAQRSPIYKLAVEWKLAFPPHPEFRTLPMVWYIPPLSPVANSLEYEDETGDVLDNMRIPVKYLANLLTAGDEPPIRSALRRMIALRIYMRSLRVDGSPNLEVLEAVGMNEIMAREMHELFAIAKYRNRYVIPTVRRETAGNLYSVQGNTGFPLPDKEE
ncbi:nitrate reductase subunit beta [Desulfomonile tiedjei]|uniref:Respiratory nitrate reductase beta subunit n=1 Tax=Desulfomonile tiedjei (strain ATCC 49306 / DSM 6799 / DCB-1) TaxID=706587 RepID=I4C292_DESTA|nr:nitrate reductase subunit beta [Desulfomonile tiedjei]AFM23683.1 respiratory nitrate reductase beta subunit [Desulfomonile tiedjei DSM 6799]